MIHFTNRADATQACRSGREHTDGPPPTKPRLLTRGRRRVITRIVPRIDPAFERLARQLTMLQLRRGDDGDDISDALSPEGPRTATFMDTYSDAGLQTVIEHYGLDAKLKERGLGDYELVITEEDPFHQRLEIVLPSLERTHVMDLRLHLARLSLSDGERVDVVAVEWLRMQNPRGQFTSSRPRLPGQVHPGTGLGKDVGQLLQLMCRRVGREGLVTVPERFHLAELYARGGWLAPSGGADRLIDEVKLAAPALSFAARAWAMERGFVFDESGAPVSYTPEERVLPVSERVQRALAPGGFWRIASQLLEPLELRRRLFVDVEALARSLETSPVEGMDPSALES